MFRHVEKPNICHGPRSSEAFPSSASPSTITSHAGLKRNLAVNAHPSATSKDDDARARIQAESDARMKIVGTELQLSAAFSLVAEMFGDMRNFHSMTDGIDEAQIR
jgi:hypothetical protein